MASFRLPSPTKEFNRLLEKETFEPTISWGLRMALAATIPVLWGMATGRMHEASWISVTAECICWVELKGSFSQGVRVLLGGIILAVAFTALGTLTATNIWLSVLCMVFVGFVTGLFKNLGDRGSGLAVCVFVLFILSNFFPTYTTEDFKARIALVSIGGIWNAVVGILITLSIPSKEPYRRTVALIWKSISELISVIDKGWDGKGGRSSVRNIYLKEKQVRIALDNSFHFYEQMAHQADKHDMTEYQLAQFRKVTALVAANATAISEELEDVNIRTVDSAFRLQLYATLKALQQTVERMAVYVITLRVEEEVILGSRLARVNKMVSLLREQELAEGSPYNTKLNRVIQLIERTIKLIETGLGRLEEAGDDKAVFRSYSLIKTVYVLHPKHWVRNLQVLFNFNTFTARYALRAAIASALALYIGKTFELRYGYWLPFTVLIVMQPYFGATLKKAIDRVIGTIAGGLIGGLLLRVPTGLYLKEFILFISFILMVYFIRTRYSVAAFFITLTLVILFTFEESLDQSVLITRAASTMAGAGLAIIAGFTLLPTWDKKWLPVHLTRAFTSNYEYFIASFFSTKEISNWTRLKRNAESKNSNAFDSFNRYMQEPSLKKKHYAIFYHLITHNVRVTRELNNIHLEQDNRTAAEPITAPTEDQQERLNTCLQWFNKNLTEIKRIYPDNTTELIQPADNFKSPFNLTAHEMVYVEKMIIELKAMHPDMAVLAQRID